MFDFIQFKEEILMILFISLFVHKKYRDKE
jgi:hypothetical protein